MIKVKYASKSAQEKVKESGGEVIIPAQKTIKKTEEKTVVNNDG